MVTRSRVPDHYATPIRALDAGLAMIPKVMMRWIHNLRVRLFPLAATAVALTFLAVSALWATSHLLTFQVSAGSDIASNEISLARGDLSVRHVSGQAGPSFLLQVFNPSDQPNIDLVSNLPPPRRMRWWRLEWERQEVKETIFLPGWRSWAIRLPWGLVLVPPVAVGTLRAVQWLRTRRHRRGSHRGFEPLRRS